MARCTEAALDDSGRPAELRAALDSVRVVWGVWPYRDPGRLVADRIGASGARTALTTVGGNQVYDQTIRTASLVAAGEIDAAVVCAAESLRTRRADRARGERTEYLTEREGAAPDEPVDPDREHFSEAEKAVELDNAVRFYAMAETALRQPTRRGRRLPPATDRRAVGRGERRGRRQSPRLAPHRAERRRHRSRIRPQPPPSPPRTPSC